MSPQFSLIMATFGRHQEVREFLQSLCALEKGSPSFEVIIVDQNDQIDLQPIVEEFHSHMMLTHLRSNRKGLSLNRNLGLKIAKGKYVAFPDDDCTYYPDTLKIVQEIFLKNPELRLAMGRIYDRQSHRNLIKNWSEKNQNITPWNFYFLYSSITIFSKCPEILFDERLGVGAKYGSGEDFDYVYQHLLQKKNTHYFPELQVWHPDQVGVQFSDSKIFSYGEGFGAGCRKNISPAILWIFVTAIAYHTLQAMTYVLRGQRELARRKYITIHARLLAFIRFS